MDIKKTGTLLKSLRVSKGYTQQQVADVLMVSPKTISKWENGDGLPDISIITAVADLYEVTVDTLLRGKITEEVKIESKKALQMDKTMAYKVFSKLMLFFYIALGINLFGIILGLIISSKYYDTAIIIMLLFLITSIVTFILGYVHYQNIKNNSDDEYLPHIFMMNTNKVRKLIWWFVLIQLVIFNITFIWPMAHHDSRVNYVLVNGFVIETPMYLILLIFSYKILNKPLEVQKTDWMKFMKLALFMLFILVVMNGTQTDFEFTEIVSGNTAGGINEVASNYSIFLFWVPEFFVFRGIALLILVISGLYIYKLSHKDPRKLGYIVLFVICVVVSFLVAKDLNYVKSIDIEWLQTTISLHLIKYGILFIFIYSKMKKQLSISA